MATFTLRRFSSPETLKTIAPKRLITFLMPHRLFFRSRDLALPPPNKAKELDYKQLVRIFMSPDTNTPKELIDSLYYVDEMATPEGMDALLTEVEERGLKLAPGSDHSPADVAVQVWLLNKDILERKHAEHYLGKVRVSSRTRWTAPRSQLSSNPPASNWKPWKGNWMDGSTEKKRGRGTKVIMCDRTDGVLVPCSPRRTVQARRESGGAGYFQCLLSPAEIRCGGLLATNPRTANPRPSQGR